MCFLALALLLNTQFSPHNTTSSKQMSSSSHQQQQANDISLADITAARNSKIAAETTETQRIASELEGAHQDALNLKEQLRQEQGDDAVPQQQVCVRFSRNCSRGGGLSSCERAFA